MIRKTETAAGIQAGRSEIQESEVSPVFGMLREQSSGRVLSGILGFRGQEKDSCDPEVTLRKTPKAAVKPTSKLRDTHGSVQRNTPLPSSQPHAGASAGCTLAGPEGKGVWDTQFVPVFVILQDREALGMVRLLLGGNMVLGMVTDVRCPSTFVYKCDEMPITSSQMLRVMKKNKDPRITKAKWKKKEEVCVGVPLTTPGSVIH